MEKAILRFLRRYQKFSEKFGTLLYSLYCTKRYQIYDRKNDTSWYLLKEGKIALYKKGNEWNQRTRK